MALTKTRLLKHDSPVHGKACLTLLLRSNCTQGQKAEDEDGNDDDEERPASRPRSSVSRSAALSAESQRKLCESGEGVRLPRERG